MHRWLVIAISLVGGCRDPGVSRLEAIRDEICACETAACGEAAMQKIGELRIESGPRTQRIARAMMDCLSKLYTADRPETGPDTAPLAGEAAPPAP